ncbi:MAG: methyltransferase domain-containing protein [Chlorobiales bacterium]|nr:methyltransferase domain-containing protein [Chlorobiales bacterium]
MQEQNSFEDRYARGDIPWDLGRVDANLVELVEHKPVPPCRALDVGCGTGDNAIWLAGHAFDVTGVDISPLAIEIARRKAIEHGVGSGFLVADFLKARIDDSPFGLVFDRGCFHSLDLPEQRELFVRNVSRHLGKEGLWLSLIASRDAPQRDPGPPRLSCLEVAAAVEPFFEILSLVSGHLDSNRPDPIRCWVCVMRKRALD